MKSRFYEKIPQTSQEKVNSGVEDPEIIGRHSVDKDKHQPYLDFSDDEKSQVMDRIFAGESLNGDKSAEGQSDFPADPEEIEDWINGHPQYFESKRLAEVARNNREYAPNLTKELADSKKDLRKKGVECSVTNIDPMAVPDTELADNAIKSDFFDMKLGAGKYDEAMALHSLPTYAFTPDQVSDFFKSSIISLKQGGILRVMPIGKFSDSFTPAMRLSRKPVSNASEKFVAKLKTRPDLFAVTEFSIEHKGTFGNKSEMPGVKIEVIGDRDEIEKFLE